MPTEWKTSTKSKRNKKGKKKSKRNSRKIVNVEDIRRLFSHVKKEHVEILPTKVIRLNEVKVLLKKLEKPKRYELHLKEQLENEYIDLKRYITQIESGMVNNDIQRRLGRYVEAIKKTQTEKVYQSLREIQSLFEPVPGHGVHGAELQRTQGKSEYSPILKAKQDH